MENSSNLFEESTITFENGMRALGEGDSKKATELLGRAYQLKSSDSKIAAEYGLCLINLGDYEKAGEVLDRALQLDPQSENCLLNKALNHMRQSQWLVALQTLEQLTKYHPQNYKALRNAGLCYGFLKRYQQAAQCLERAIQLWPGYTAARIDLGTICVHAGRPDLGLEIFEDTLRRDPRSQETRNLINETKKLIQLQNAKRQ